jgi:hypothetical protein
VRRLDKYIHFYIGCDTNKGKLVGVKHESLLVQAEGEQGIVEYDTELLGNDIFLYLQRLDDLSEGQSKELIKRGMAIGRPNGYTFSKEGFFYLISLNVDIFGLINSGYAKPINNTP